MLFCGKEIKDMEHLLRRRKEKTVNNYRKSMLYIVLGSCIDEKVTFLLY